MHTPRAIVLLALSLGSLVFSATSMADHQAYAVSILENSYSPLNRRFMALLGQNDLKSIEELVSSQPNINVADGKGVRLVHYAAFIGNIDVLNLLVARGADPKAATIGGWTTLHYAVHNGQLEMAKLLVSKGLPIEAKDLGGETPLFYAVEAGHIATVQWLIAKGADVNNGNNQGEMPLTAAKEHKHQQIVDLLLKAGAKEGAPYKPGREGHD